MQVSKKNKAIAFGVTFLLHALIAITPVVTTKDSTPSAVKKPMTISMTYTTPKPTPPPKPKPKPKRKVVHQKKKKVIKKRIKQNTVTQIKEPLIKKETPKPNPTPTSNKSRGISAPLKIAKSILPIYPKQALNLNMEGHVKVNFHINSSGEVISYNIVKSSGHPTLDDAFIRTVSQSYSITPKMKDGKAVSGNLVLEHQFKL